MFKPGEVARIKNSDRSVTIESGGDEASGVKWPIKTSGGIFTETDLTPAHTSVVDNAEAKEDSQDFHTPEDFDPGGFVLASRVGEVLKLATLDTKGHWENGAKLDSERVLMNLFFSTRSIPKEDAEALILAAASGEPLDRWVQIDTSLWGSSSFRCPSCGESNLGMETNGQVMRVQGSGCPFPEGLPLTEWELNVPSGKIVVANDLRRIFPILSNDFDIGTGFGCRATSLAYAAIGLSHAYVGNTCPKVFKGIDGTFTIANSSYEEEDESTSPKEEGDRVASICTDLWWYSICDQDEFKLRCKHFQVKAKTFRTQVVTLKPGVYRFTHDERATPSDNGTCLYTRFEWVREPDPVKDYLSVYHNAPVISPNAYVQTMVARWPSLYGNGRKTPWSSLTEAEKLRGWQSVSDSVFCTIGSGIDWHEQGYPKTSVDPCIQDEDPPSFRAQYSWYPFSSPYGGLFQPKLTPSFAKLAFRVLESVISFGSSVRDDAHSRDVRYVRERMLLAVERYRELLKEYPEQADPEYAAWLSQVGRAEAWVANFPLGPEITEKHLEHAAKQRWVPEGTYAVAFDARKLSNGTFASEGYWANKENATRYAILEWHDNEQKDDRFNCSWHTHAKDTAIPLYSVARVVKLGQVDSMGDVLVEVAFDYGTPWMLDTGVRKAIPEKYKGALKVLTKEKYDLLLPKAIAFK